MNLNHINCYIKDSVLKIIKDTYLVSLPFKKTNIKLPSSLTQIMYCVVALVKIVYCEILAYPGNLLRRTEII